MERRRYLGALGAGALALAGCVGAPVSHGCGAGGSDATGTPAGGRAAAFSNVSLPVPDSALTRATTRDAIPAIVDPAFGPDWSGTARPLRDDDIVVGLAREGRARAYPLATLSTYEVVNEDFGGPLLVTYCPLCASAVVAERRVRGEATVFGVTGNLFRSNLVMYDRLTDSQWSQVLARAIRGPATGERLTLVPSTVASWSDWRAANPDTQVLLPPPASGTIVQDTRGRSTRVRGPVGVVEVGSDFEDDRLSKGALVVGVATPEATRAYALSRIRAAGGVVNDCVGSTPVVVAAAGRVPVAYDRRVAGRPLVFEAAGDGRLRAGGSTWDVATGRALSGPHAGTTLARARGGKTMFWFAWLDFHPETTVWRGGRR